jgi:hypothetical protein
MQCHHNLILPIIVPVASYLVLRYFTNGQLDPSVASSDTSLQNGGTNLSKMKELQDEEEMKRWSSRNLRINDPKHNPFMVKPKTKTDIPMVILD